MKTEGIESATTWAARSSLEAGVGSGRPKSGARIGEQLRA
jgi:hypothetical protein